MSGRDGSFLVVGGAGFIGSHFIDRLARLEARPPRHGLRQFLLGPGVALRGALRRSAAEGRRTGDIHDFPALREAMAGHDTVIHLASNPDIARAVTEPDIDFREGTELTNHVVEAMRQSGGRTDPLRLRQRRLRRPGRAWKPDEDHGPLMPVSTYGASKLAGEALIAVLLPTCSTCEAVPFASATSSAGGRPTASASISSAGCCKDPTQLRILGDGRQSKSYVHVSDVVIAPCSWPTRQLRGPSRRSTSPRAITSRSRRSPTWRASAWVWNRTVSLRVHRRRPRLEGRRAGHSHQHRQDPPASGWRPTRTSAQALGDAMLAMLADLNGRA